MVAAVSSSSAHGRRSVIFDEIRRQLPREYPFHFAQSPIADSLAEPHDGSFTCTALITDFSRI